MFRELRKQEQNRAAMLLANRERREGKPVMITRAQRRTQRSFERDAEQARAKLLNNLPTESEEVLLNVIRSAMRDDNVSEQHIFGKCQPDDCPIHDATYHLRDQIAERVRAFASGTCIAIFADRGRNARRSKS